jgi:uncharacterized protein (TIGR02246 family)
VSPSGEKAALRILEDFCSGFARRDAEGVMELFADDPDIMVVTSEESVLRGPDELRGFLRSYARGQTAYSWSWGQRHVVIGDGCAWLVAEGHETVSSGNGEASHPYRMTMVLERRDEAWLVVHAHGSTPSD